MTDSRLLLVSNRLPVSAQTTLEGIRVVPTSGGLATGPGAWHRRADGLWCGWPGDVTVATAAQREALEHDLHARGLVPVHLGRDLTSRYYRRGGQS
jgi:trehalose 6-phosphate synthase/phosphatase